MRTLLKVSEKQATKVKKMGDGEGNRRDYGLEQHTQIHTHTYLIQDVH